MINKKIIILLLSFIMYPFISQPSFALPERDKLSTNDEEQQIPMEDVQRFSNALSLIKKYYVKQIDDKVLFDNAIRGMLNGLDPHSGYLDENDFQELQTATNGEFGGLGIEVTMESGVVKVITPLVDTPAFKAGVKSGDYIIKIDNKSVQGIELKDAVNLMHGPSGSPITLTILRRGEKKPIIKTINREKIEIKSVQNRLLNGKYGYIRLTQFQSMTEKDMLTAIKKLQNEAGGKLKGLILDLRNNPGGLLDSAIEVSSTFLNKERNGKKEMVVYTKGRLPGSKFTAMAQASDILYGAPMVVLINNGSASASEIVAGALKDNNRALILGTKSFGKGSVQTVLPLDDKRAIKLTTALYYTPSGKSIQARGITPDIIIEEITVPKNSNQSDVVVFSEADLSGHLKNGNKNTRVSRKNSQDEINLLHEDYQLYAALTILKGLAVAGH
ncbi:MAG: peptidase S41 [Legionellales bacterium RIFCSPHIGHO2_12_FULL_35_11]|nr:MAG: peptidase S41 [Legionellales bacterium RIFCSPHIGHO2_12_FULL_35_11]